MPINLIPVLIGGGVFVYASRKSKNRRKKAKTQIKEQQKALPEDKNAGDKALGNVYNGKEVDVIEASVGEEFAIELPAPTADGFGWSLEASPPDNSIEFLNPDDEPLPPEATFTVVDTSGYTAPGTGPHKFKAVKAGSGSLIFHYRRPTDKGKQPPGDIVEVETKIS